MTCRIPVRTAQSGSSPRSSHQFTARGAIAAAFGGRCGATPDLRHRLLNMGAVTPGKPGDKGARGALVVPVLVTSRLEGLGLSRRNAGDAEQEEQHQGRTEPGQPAA